MADAPAHIAFLADQNREFRLTPEMILELERLSGLGIGAIFKRLIASDFRHADLVATIRLAQIGGRHRPGRGHGPCRGLRDPGTADEDLPASHRHFRTPHVRPARTESEGRQEMTGRIQRTIAAVFEAKPHRRFTVRELAEVVFPGEEIAKRHTDSVNRALIGIASSISLTKSRVGLANAFGWQNVWGRRNSSEPVQLVAGMAELEIRHGVVSDILDFETRFTAPTDTGEIEGVAVRFNTVDTCRTEFAPDAFRGLEGRSIPMLWSHDPANVIGSWSSFQVRADGLTAKDKLNLAVAKAQEVRSLLQAGDVRGLSIGFTVRRFRP